MQGAGEFAAVETVAEGLASMCLISSFVRIWAKKRAWGKRTVIAGSPSRVYDDLPQRQLPFACIVSGIQGDLWELQETRRDR